MRHIQPADLVHRGGLTWRGELARWGLWWWSSAPASLLEGLGGHLRSSGSNLIYTLYDPNRPRSGEWIQVVGNYLPNVFELATAIAGVALLTGSVVMLLGAFKVMTYPARLQRFAPAVLGAVIATMIIIQVFVPPFTAITRVVFRAQYAQPVFFF